MKAIVTFLASTLLVSSFFNAVAREEGEQEFRYISPMPDSRYIMPGNNIALRHGDKLDRSCLDAFLFEVEGSLSGVIKGRTVLSDDERTILFLPDMPYLKGEVVHVKTRGQAFTLTGVPLEGVDYTFTVTPVIPEWPKEPFMNEPWIQTAPFSGKGSKYKPANKMPGDNNLPEDFPELTVEVLNESNDNGYYFVSPFGYWGWFPDNTPYVIAFDDHAVPVFYQRLDNHGYDFKLNANGLLSFFYNEWPAAYYRIFDQSCQQVNTYTMQNGYTTDFHEFFMLENGHAFVMANDPQIIDMSQVVPGGVPDAIVSGWVFQELDTDKNVVFQWRSWDHYDILDAEGYVNLTSSVIDLIHGNAIEVTPDGNALLLSPRNLNEITKVDRNTGEIIWRLNGNNNMFEFINDTLGFSMQHDCRVMSNGHVSIFDNGSDYPAPQFSSVVEYDIDTENFTATLVRRLRNDPDIFGEIMGSAQEMPNGNMVAGWGSGVPGVTEFDNDGNVSSTYYFAGINYRAYRHQWTTDYFTVDKNALDFGWIWMEDQKTKSVNVTNNQDEDIVLTSHHLRGDKFTLETALPVIVPAGGGVTLQVTFDPGEEGTFEDVLTINSDVNSDTLVRRIAQQVSLTGHATQGQGVGDLNAIGMVVSPNPVKDLLKVTFKQEQQEVQVAVSDITGRTILSTRQQQVKTCVMDMGPFPDGLYFVTVRENKSGLLATMKVLKKQ